MERGEEMEGKRWEEGGVGGDEEGGGDGKGEVGGGMRREEMKRGEMEREEETEKVPKAHHCSRKRRPGDKAEGPDSPPPHLKHLVVLQFSGLPTDESFAVKEERAPSFIADDEVSITTDMDRGLRKGGGEERGREEEKGNNLLMFNAHSTPLLPPTLHTCTIVYLFP